MPLHRKDTYHDPQHNDSHISLNIRPCSCSNGDDTTGNGKRRARCFTIHNAVMCTGII
nr:MAG TPA: hypothetical protein [Caudoviricetes sp.]